MQSEQHFEGTVLDFFDLFLQLHHPNERTKVNNIFIFPLRPTTGYQSHMEPKPAILGPGDQE